MLRKSGSSFFVLNSYFSALLYGFIYFICTLLDMIRLGDFVREGMLETCNSFQE